MATPKAQIAEAVKGLTVKYAPRWQDPKIAGFDDPTWSPKFVMLHHTGGTSSYSGLASGAFGGHKPVPGANFLVNRDGSVAVLSRYITYHAGKGGPRWGVPANLMNPVCWGIEIEDLGRERTMTAAQIDATARLAAGLLRAMGRDLDCLIQHKEWSSTGKPDTLYTTAFWRDKVGEHLRPEASASSAPDPLVVTAYRNVKVATEQVIPLNQWVDLDLGPDIPSVIPPVGSDDWWFQLHLDLSQLTGASRNDLRYVKGRWARIRPGSADANEQGLDTHGTDTKAIPADLPKASWQGAWSTDMKGVKDVPVKAQVYVGSTVDGTVVSPMRLFTVDDENT